MAMNTPKGKPNPCFTAVRENLGLRKSDMARIIGLTPARVSHIESGLGSFSVANWLRFWDVFEHELTDMGIRMEDLLRGEYPIRRKIRPPKREARL